MSETPLPPYADDERLYAQIKAKQQSVINTLYRSYRSSFVAYALNLCWSKQVKAPRDEILGIYNEAFAAMILNIQQDRLRLPLKSTLKTYLFAIGRNKCLRWIDKQMKDRHEFVDFAEEPTVDLSSLKLDFDPTLGEQVHQLLQQLNESCRELLTLIYLKGWHQEAIIDKMAIPSPEAYRKRKFDCLKKLRKQKPPKGE